MKPVHWIGSSREDLKDFPKKVRREIGFALETAQNGEKHTSAKPLRGFGGAGVLEIVGDRESRLRAPLFQEEIETRPQNAQEHRRSCPGTFGAGRGGLQAMAKGKRSMTPSGSLPVTRGSGNVFADLGFPDAEELQVKAALTRRI